MSPPQHPGLELRVLGELQVLRDGVPVDLPASKKTRALLAYLVTSRKVHLREHLCNLLWESPDDPRGGLRWSLSKLRPLLDDEGAVRLSADRERVGVQLQGAALDLATVESAAPRRSLDLPSLRAACAAFRGPFVEGLDLPDCPRFQAWCRGTRDDLDRLRGDLLERLVGHPEIDPEEALRYARMLVALDPSRESGHTHLVRILGLLGRVREAREAYDHGRSIMEGEHGVRFSPSLEEARRALRPAEGPPKTSTNQPAGIDPFALDLYARGRYFWLMRAGEGFEDNSRKAAALFEQAAAVAPGFARAHAGVARCHVPLGYLGVLPPAMARAKIRTAAQAALALDPSLAEAHTALAACMAFFEWDWEGAERAFAHALALDPEDSVAHLWYAAFVGSLGRQAENLAARRRAIEIDPFNFVLGGPAFALALLGRYNEAIDEYRKALDLGPGFANTRNNLGRLYLHLGRYAEAIAAFTQTGSRADLAQALARAGRPDEARALLSALEERARATYVSPVDLACVHAALGQTEPAFAMLERAFDERTPALHQIKILFGLEPLRSEPRYRELLIRMRLA